MAKSVHTKAYVAVRQQLIAARKQAGFTQAEIAKKLSRPQSFVAKYEAGERRLDIVEFLQIAQTLGLNASAAIRKIAALVG